MMAAAPPIIKIGPPPAKSTGRAGLFNKWYATHKGMAQLRATIEQYASLYGVPELALAAIIWKESKGQNEASPGAKGWGVAQININAPPSAAAQVLGRKLTQADAMNVDTSIHILAQAYANSGAGSNVDQFYANDWNPGWKPSPGSFGGTPPSGFLKGIPITATGHTPQQKAGGAVADAQAKAANLPDQLALAKRILDPTYLAYAGRTATQAELKQYINTGESLYQLQQRLSNPTINPAFYKSPVWKTNEPRLEAVYKGIYGQDAVIDQGARQQLAYAIAHNLDETGFAQRLRDQPGYSGSQEYKQNAAAYQSSYSRIYGAALAGSGADMVAKIAIDQAVRKGWSQDQWDQYLRSQPAYQSSAEFKTQNINLAERMGLLHGDQAQTMLQQVNQGVPGGGT